jgi:DNA-directed RNA polymerase II subunit RPB1
VKWNIFLCQSIQSQIELEEIADVKRQIITPSSSRTSIGIAQDGLVGAYKLTDSKVRIDRKNAMNIVSYTSVEDFSVFKKSKEELTGHELFSLIIPEKINISKYDDGKPILVIKNGTLTDGYIKGDSLAAGKKNSLVQLIWDEYGVEETKDFMNNTSRLINNYLLWNGFTVGIGDMTIGRNVEEEIQKTLQTRELKVQNMITEIENNPELMDEDLFENTLFSELNVARDDVGKLIQSNNNPDNCVTVMHQSGSKGDANNTGQMSGCIGLQSVEGKLPQKKINNRTIPYFHENDDTAVARGLVKQSFLRGTRFPEFFFINMAAREGLISSAVLTAESGYIQRKLIKILEDAVIAYDKTVRTANNGILQFMYGDAGSNTIKQYEHNIKLIELSNTEIMKKYCFNDDELKDFKNYSKKDNQQYYETLLKMRDELRNIHLKTKLDMKTLSSTYMIPVNIVRVVDSIKNTNMKGDKLEPNDIIKGIDNIVEKARLVNLTNDEIADKSNLRNKDDKIAKTLFNIALYEYLSPKRCINDFKLNKKQFDEIVNEFIKNYNKNMIEPGEMVGIIAAQAMGEPITQMTLNAFHSAGIGRMSATTSGVPRIKEILGLSKKIKTPQMIITLNEQYMNSRDMANKIGSYIKYITIGQLRKQIDVYYEPDPFAKGGFREKDNVYNVFYGHNPGKHSCQADIANLPWLMRIVFDREKLLEKEVTLLDIKSKFCNAWEKRFSDIKSSKKEERAIFDKITQCAILSNTNNDDIPIIHIRFDMSEIDYSTITEFIDTIVDKFKLKGITSITNSFVNEERVLKYNNDGGVEKVNHFQIYTNGVNLYDIRYIIGINMYKTFTNDIIEIYETFGIEATRLAIIRQIVDVYDRAGKAANYQHLTILAEIMTVDGHLLSIDRHGMKKSKTDPLPSASFEKTVDVLLSAAVFGETDHMKGISSRIMAGQVIKGGTGMCDLLLDTEMIEKSEFTEDIGQKYIKTYNEITTSSVINDVINKEETGIFIPEY